MEDSLTQRILLTYYKTKFRLLQTLSPQKAAAATLKLFFTPYLTHRKAERPAIFHKAEKLSFTFQGHTLYGAKWQSSQPGSKTILVCHGMNSCSYRFDKYVQLLLANHFNVVAFDAQAHGQSEGKLLNAVVYGDIIIEIEKLYGPFDGIIAHSVAGMGTALAMEQIKDNNKKIVLIAPATETVTAVDNFFQKLKLPDSLRKAFEQEIINVRNRPSVWYSTTRAIQNFNAPVLWVHDTADSMCPYKDTLAIQQIKPAHVQFMITSGLGHNKIYRDDKVQKAIINFLLQ